MQTAQFTPVYIAANFIIYMFIFTSIMLNCGARLKTWLTVLLYAVSFSGMMALTWSLPVHTMVRTLLCWIYVTLVAVLLFKGTLIFRIIATAASLLAMMLSDLFLGFMLPKNDFVTGVIYTDYSLPLYSTLVFINLILQGITVVFVRIIKKRSYIFTSRLFSLVFLLFPISQLVSIWLYYSAYIDQNTMIHLWQMVPVIVIYILADAALIFSLKISEKNARIQTKNEMLEEQIAFQKDYYAQLGSSYEQIRKMRHDIDNHLYTIQLMLASGKTEEAREYADELSANDNIRSLFSTCENTVVASFLEKKKIDMEKDDIILKCDICLPGQVGISNPDLICALGNILDNAQEACSRHERAIINLSVSFNEPYLSILCENPDNKDENQQKRRIPELERGLGMLILKNLAEQYDGEFRTQTNGETFCTRLVLKAIRQGCQP